MKSRFILLFISLFVSLCFTEIIFRINGKYPTYTERTGTSNYVSPFETGSGKWYPVHAPYINYAYTTREYAASWLTNNEGLNDKNFELRKSGTRIMVLGDSFTEGAGASNDSTYPKQLGLILKDSLPVLNEVWNCGVCGSDIFFEYILFRDKLLKYKPDMAIVTINGTDILETITRGGFERFNKDGTVHFKKGPWFEPLFAHSFLVRRIVFDYFHYNWLFIKKESEQQANEVAISKLYTAMDSFAITCHQQNIKLLFVFHPGQIELEKRAAYLVEPQIIYCRKMQYPFIDTREEFYKMGIDSSNITSLYWNIDGHFNNTGYNYLAGSVWRKVVDELAVK